VLVLCVVSHISLLLLLVIHIETQTYSAVSSVSFNDVFTADYTNYFVTLVSRGDSANSTVAFRLRAGGTDESSAVYDRQRVNSVVTVISATQNLADNSLSLLGSNRRNCTSLVTIFRPQINTRTDFTYSSSAYDANFADSTLQQVVGEHRNNYQADGFSIIFGSASSGQINVYGYKD